VGCGSRLAVRGGDPHRREARGRVGGAVPWLEVLVRGEPFFGGTWIFEDAPWCGARAEVKARTRTTLCGARGWLLRCSRRGGTAHVGGGARCDLKIRAMAERPDGDGKGRCNEEGKTKPASTSRVYGGWRTWPW
jgi:hypothetical protein